MKTPNYTQAQVAQITEAYNSGQSIDEIADAVGKSVRSVRSKLVREGVYVAQPRTTKTGEPVIAKIQYVNAISEHFGVELPTLVKSGKQDLQRLAEVLELTVVAK